MQYTENRGDRDDQRSQCYTPQKHRKIQIKRPLKALHRDEENRQAKGNLDFLLPHANEGEIET